MPEIKLFRGIARLNGVDLFYMDTRSDGEAILCLHGRCGRAETWVDFLRHYGDRYRVVAPDLRGHGLSGRPLSDYTDREMADDMVALMEHLDIPSAIVVGHSMGGAVAGYLAALYPGKVKAVAILDKSASGPESYAPEEAIPGLNPVKDWPLPFPSHKDAMETIRRFSGSELEYQYFMNSLTETVDGFEMMFDPHAIARGIGHYVNWFPLLSRIRCPVLLVRSGSHEAVPNADWVRMQEMLPGCIAREMTHPDHNVHLANAEEFYGVMDEFLSGLTPIAKGNP